MNDQRVNIRFTAAQLRRLDKLAEKLGLDRSSTIRYCITRIAETEKIPAAERR
ncbi:MAG TPA: ribbon-helix-helix protein, CopG family [Acidobacteriaceae bacterium]|nr:ribbon-helix-helix protein, CopG family [Acidobacteriaceae bacterium]